MNATSGAPDARATKWPTIKVGTTEIIGVAIFVLLGAMYFVRLGAGSLWDNSEPTYGEIVKELFRTGDWLTLHLNYLPWDTHPPLWFWTAAGSVMLFGLDEFALRLRARCSDSRPHTRPIARAGACTAIRPV